MMSSAKTVNDLFEYAIALEKAAESLYLAFEKMFSQDPEVAAFWHRYADEEDGHALYLENVRAGLDADRLSQPADPGMLEKVLHCIAQASSVKLDEIENLDDAYQLAVELENSETNAVFEFMIVNFSTDELAKAHKFLRTQLSTHIGRLDNEFPYMSRLARQHILAQK